MTMQTMVVFSLVMSMICGMNTSSNMTRSIDECFRGNMWQVLCLSNYTIRCFLAADIWIAEQLVVFNAYINFCCLRSMCRVRRWNMRLRVCSVQIL